MKNASLTNYCKFQQNVTRREKCLQGKKIFVETTLKKTKPFLSHKPVKCVKIVHRVRHIVTDQYTVRVVYFCNLYPSDVHVVSSLYRTFLPSILKLFKRNGAKMMFGPVSWKHKRLLCHDGKHFLLTNFKIFEELSIVVGTIFETCDFGNLNATLTMKETHIIDGSLWNSLYKVIFKFFGMFEGYRADTGFSPNLMSCPLWHYVMHFYFYYPI